MDNNIPYPSEAEKAASVSYIVEKGVRRQSGPSSIREAAGAAGLRGLFFGVEDCLFIAVMLFFLLSAFSTLAAMEHTPVAPLLFLLSPALFAALRFLTGWKDAMSKTLEWKRTCRLNFRAVTALRMLCFGGAAALVCVPQCLLLWRVTGRLYPLPWMMSLSFSSLFLYAALSLYLQTKHRRLLSAAGPVIWIAAGMALLRWDKANLFLLKVPAVVFVLIAAAAAVMLLAEINRYIAKPAEGGDF